VYCIVDFSLV